MKKYFAIVYKEYLQLIRDLPALIILFLMPVVMLIVITLSQERVMIGKGTGMGIIMINADSSDFGNSVEQELISSGYFRYALYKSEKEAEADILTGMYQVMVLIPDSATEKLNVLALQQNTDSTEIWSAIDHLVDVELVYDPAVLNVYKELLVSSVRMIVQSTALGIYNEKHMAVLKSDVARQFDDYRQKLSSVDIEKELPDFPNKEQVVKTIRDGFEEKSEQAGEIKLSDEVMNTEGVLNVNERAAIYGSLNANPNILSVNIPAFILFAMFFIVLPLAGSIINEKQQGTKDRLMTLPVNSFTFISGKVTMYLIVCIMQFFLMVAIGKYGFPVISHLPSLSLDVNVTALSVSIISSGLAAIGFGLLIGTFTNTNAQAAPLGSALVVILAVIGGIFFPDYLMPESIKKISIISPLKWGTNAFFNIFARGADLKIVYPQILSLISFFMVSIYISATSFAKRK
jgi:ABC-2 type transport system permease protein